MSTESPAKTILGLLMTGAGVLATGTGAGYAAFQEIADAPACQTQADALDAVTNKNKQAEMLNNEIAKLRDIEKTHFNESAYNLGTCLTKNKVNSGKCKSETAAFNATDRSYKSAQDAKMQPLDETTPAVTALKDCYAAAAADKRNSQNGSLGLAALGLMVAGVGAALARKKENAPSG